MPRARGSIRRRVQGSRARSTPGRPHRKAETRGPRCYFCLFGFGLEHDYCTFNRAGLTTELQRQIRGAGPHGAFVAGTPIMPPDADPDAVDFYFSEARRLGRYRLEP